MKRLKVLMSAYACEPNMGSEPGVGWNIAKEMAEHHDVWVITRVNNRAPIEAESAQNPRSNLRFIYYDLPHWLRFWKKGSRGVEAYYYLWQLGSYGVARRLHKTIGFDLAHHVTFVRYWSPSLLACLPIPFVWGPVGGGESAPKPLCLSKMDIRYEFLRDTVRWLGECDPLVRLTARKSKMAIATTKETAERLNIIGAQDIQIFSQCGLNQEEIAHLGALPLQRGEKFRCISIGRLLHWKGFHFGLCAFAQARLPDAEYWFVGEGPDLERLKLLAKELNIEERVHFWGKLSREDTLNKLAKSHVLVHPSLHDSGGWVCLEAMAAGRPVICLDLGGPALQVTEETGFKIPAHSPEQAVNDLALALQRLANDESLWLRMGMAGRVHITQNYSWEQKISSLQKTYMAVADASN